MASWGLPIKQIIIHCYGIFTEKHRNAKDIPGINLCVTTEDRNLQEQDLEFLKFWITYKRNDEQENDLNQIEQ